MYSEIKLLKTCGIITSIFVKNGVWTQMKVVVMRMTTKSIPVAVMMIELAVCKVTNNRIQR